MKRSLTLAIAIALCSSVSFAKPVKKVVSACEQLAVTTALEEMDKLNTDGLTDDNDKPRALTDAEKAYLNEVIYLDQNGEVSDAETGSYGVVMGVMEECLDGLLVKTKKKIKAGKETCEVQSVEAWGQRDCG